MQYTLRHIPPELDRALKQEAKQRGLSVNQLVLELLRKSTGLAPKRRNLREMPGAWSKQEAKRFDQLLAEQRRIDEEVWK
jgi:hypothetical protein